MRFPNPFQFLIISLIGIFLLSSTTAIAASNTVPNSRVDHINLPIGINDIRPSACAGLYMDNYITGTGTITGTAGNDLILASPASDNIDGLGGNDCILGGGGDDQITGGDGNDICLGGPDTDTFTTCEGEIQ